MSLYFRCPSWSLVDFALCSCLFPITSLSLVLGCFFFSDTLKKDEKSKHFCRGPSRLKCIKMIWLAIPLTGECPLRGWRHYYSLLYHHRSVPLHLVFTSLSRGVLPFSLECFILLATLRSGSGCCFLLKRKGAS